MTITLNQRRVAMPPDKKVIILACKLDDSEVPGDPMASAMVRAAQLETGCLERCAHCELQLAPTDSGMNCQDCMDFFAERARVMAGITG